MLKRAPLCYSETLGGWTVDLPSFQMIAGTFAPLTPGVIEKDHICPTDADGKPIAPAQVLELGPSVLVNLPEYTPLDASGQIDREALAEMYPHGRCASPDYVPPVLSAP